MNGYAVEVLKRNSLKVTPQRLAIYEFMLDSKEHPSADAVYRALMEEYPALSLATVYKTLSCFKNNGLIRELSVGGDSFRYDADTSSHAHFVCGVCGEVSDIDLSERFKEVRSAICSEYDFFLEYEQINFYGKCGKCK